MSKRWTGWFWPVLLAWPLELAAGCSSNSASSAQGEAGADGGSKDSAASAEGAATPMGDGSIDSLCQAMTASGACAKCCESSHSAGVQAYETDLFTCACAANSACTSLCADTYCMHQSPAVGSNCDNCVAAAQGDGGACVAPVASACQADPSCAAYRLQCLAGCP